jgi:hypothetical protein
MWYARRESWSNIMLVMATIQPWFFWPPFAMGTKRPRKYPVTAR